MRVHLCVVGRLRGGPENDLVSDYLTRFDRTGRALGLGPARVVEVEDKKGGGKQVHPDAAKLPMGPGSLPHVYICGVWPLVCLCCSMHMQPPGP